MSFCSLALDDENDSHAMIVSRVNADEASSPAAVAAAQTEPVKKLKFAKTTFNKAPPLYSQRIVIGTEELSGGKSIEKLVRQKIDLLEKSPKVVRSTALIVKTLKTAAEPAVNGINRSLTLPAAPSTAPAISAKLNGTFTPFAKYSAASGAEFDGAGRPQVNRKRADPSPGNMTRLNGDRSLFKTGEMLALLSSISQ